MRYKLAIALFLIANSLWSQGKHLLYNQTHNPQSLMLNPGAAYEKTDFHIGVPFLSNIYASVGNTELTIDNIFNANDINDNIAEAIDKISSKDFGAFHQKLDLINIGWRRGQRYYSAGVYQETDAVFNFPKDLIELAYYGNAGRNRSYDIGEINVKANLQTVFHFGINKQVNEKLHLGARAKLYTSSLNLKSVQNSGRFVSRADGPGLLLDQDIRNLNLRFNSTGIKNADELTPGDFIIGSNFGLGLDLGLSYNFNDRLEFTASLLDLGFIQFSENTRNNTTQGFYDYESLNVQFPDFASGESLNTYYQNLKDEIVNNLPTENTSNPYTYVQPVKLNLGLTYSFGTETTLSECGLKEIKSSVVDQKLSLHGFSMVNAGNLFYSLNAMYERKLWDRFYAKVSLGTDQFNRLNYGGGLALDVGKVNLFMNVDRLNHFSNIYKANALAYQFGLNLKL